MVKDKCATLDNYKEGSDVKVSFDIRSHMKRGVVKATLDMRLKTAPSAIRLRPPEDPEDAAEEKCRDEDDAPQQEARQDRLVGWPRRAAHDVSLGRFDGRRDDEAPHP
jgi:hypothetical protein